MAEGNTGVILAALHRHGSGIRSSEVFVLGLDGKVVVSTLAAPHAWQLFPYDTALRHARRNGLQMLIVALDGQPYLLVQDDVLEPAAHRRVVMGFADGPTVRQRTAFHEQPGSVVSRSVRTVAPARCSALSPTTVRADILATLRRVPATSEAYIERFHGQRMLSQVLSLANTGESDEVRVLLQSPLDHALESFAPLDRQFLGIALAVLVVSLAGALFLARRVSRPLNALVEAG